MQVDPVAREQQRVQQQVSAAQKERLTIRLNLEKAEVELAALAAQAKDPPAVTVPDSALDEEMKQDPVVKKLLDRLVLLDETIQRIRDVSAVPTRAAALRKPLAEQAAVLEALDKLREHARRGPEAKLRAKARADRADDVVQGLGMSLIVIDTSPVLSVADALMVGQHADAVLFSVFRDLEGRFVLAGFRTDLERFLPHWDVAVLSSFTEGLPVIVLEAAAAAVPVVATAVGGTPEVVEDGRTGYLVPPRRPGGPGRRHPETATGPCPPCSPPPSGRPASPPRPW
jgi:glycosyltransferase involved in cell wall biosynthesis